MADDERIYLGSKDQITEILDTDAFVIVTGDGIRKMTKAQVMEKLGISELKDTIGNGKSEISSDAIVLLTAILRKAVYVSDQSAKITALASALESSGDSDDSGADIPEESEIYTITNNLTGVTTNNTATYVIESSTYTATLTVLEGYSLRSVTVTMGGEDVTETVYVDGVVTIESVTGDVVIETKCLDLSTSIHLVQGGINSSVRTDGLYLHTEIHSLYTNRASYVGFDIQPTSGKTYRLEGLDSNNGVGIHYGIQYLTPEGLTTAQAGEYLVTGTHKVDTGWHANGYEFVATDSMACIWITAHYTDNSAITPEEAMPVYIVEV